jgi:hypothetical protein
MPMGIPASPRDSSPHPPRRYAEQTLQINVIGSPTAMPETKPGRWPNSRLLTTNPEVTAAKRAAAIAIAATICTAFTLNLSPSIHFVTKSRRERNCAMPKRSGSRIDPRSAGMFVDWVKGDSIHGHARAARVALRLPSLGHGTRRLSVIYARLLVSIGRPSLPA